MAGIMPRESCAECLAGQHLACINLILQENYCNCEHIDTPIAQPVSVIGNALNLDPDTPLSDKPTRRHKNDSAVRDPNSTGRKRAAAMYPLKDENGKRFPCDLVGKTTALPNYYEIQIDGCNIRPATMSGHAQERHHWNYNTLDNTRENIGLLCSSCHHLIHARNDPYKDKIYERLYGYKPSMEDLSHASKALISGVIDGGTVKAKNQTSK